MKKILLLLTLMACIKANAQQDEKSRKADILKYKSSTDTIVYPNRRIKTDVFILNTCDPLQISFRRKYDDDSLSFGPYKKVRKLEVRSNRLSSFKIEGINPLRYQYFINSEAVTQFVDASPLSILSNILKKDGSFSPFEITVPKIFKEDIEKNNSRRTIDSFESLLNKSRETVNQYARKLWNQKYAVSKGSKGYPDRSAAKETNTAESDSNYEKFDELRSQMNEIVDQFDKYLSTLPISNANLWILNDSFAASAGSPVLPILTYIRKFAADYKYMDSAFNFMDYQLAAINENFGPAQDSMIDGLNVWLVYFHHPRLLKYDPTALSGISGKLQILDLREWLIRKRYQAYQEFILGTITQIGTMLQSSFRQISSFTNSLKMQNCLEDSAIDSIRIFKQFVGEEFDFVQKISSEFQVLVSYLDIDNKIYGDIIKGINSNYISLLGYLKTFEYLEHNNTIEFTLPTSTNVKNIDLIRYKIDRKDNVGGGEQSYTYDLWVRGGLKVDFSIGIFASGLTDNQYQKYQYDSSGHLTDSVELSRQRAGNYSFGFGGMVNITPRLGTSWVNAGLSLGVIYSTNQKLQFITAAALHLGKTERLILHGGIGFGFIQSLDRSQQHMTMVEKDNTYRVKADVNEYSVPYIQKFSVRPVFGLSYNLSGKNALQAVSDKGLDKYNELNKPSSQP